MILRELESFNNRKCFYYLVLMFLQWNKGAKHWVPFIESDALSETGEHLKKMLFLVLNG
jgi:hypothetical protein